MDKRWLAAVAAVFTALTTLLILLCLAGRAGRGVSRLALAALLEEAAPAVTAVDPAFAPNDIDTPIVITGTGLNAGFSGTLTLIITQPTAYLGATALEDVSWVSTTTLTATVPWGLAPGVYTLTVVNPDGESGGLPGAFSVTQGFGVWTTGGPYGGEIVVLVLNPVTPTTVYALAHNAGLFASYDAAAHWQPILLAATPDLLVFDAEDPQVMYFGQPLLRTKDGGGTWESILPPGGYGALYPAAHPITPGVVYVGSNARPGLFRSDDYGDTWVTLTVGPTDTLVTTIAFHPDDPDQMLAGAPDGNVFLSTDGGETWGWAAQVSSHVERLYFNPFGAHEAWATTEVVYGPHYYPPHYLYKSEDPELGVWTPITVAGGNVVRSLTFLSDTIWSAGAEGFTSTDGGASWSPVSTAGPLPERTGDTKAFAIDPSNPQIVYAGDLGHAMFKSSDGGATWSKMNQGLAAVVPRALAVSPTDPDTIYAGTSALGVVKSSNGGRSWRALGIEGNFKSPLAVDPFTLTRVYLGASGSGYMRLHISDDAGATWHEVTATLPVTWTGWKADILNVAPHPNISATILAGARFLLSWALPDAGTERGAIYISDNYGEHWDYMGPTQPISTVVEFAFDAVDPNLIYAATYGTGLWKSADGGTSWGQVTSLPGGEPIITSVAAHPDLPNTVYARCADPPQGMPTLYVSRDAGETWEELPPCDNCDRLLFTPPERGKPPYTLYTTAYTLSAGSTWPSGLYSSMDGGYTWEQVEGAPTTDIYSLAAGSDGERVVVYVGISGGVVSHQSQAAAASAVTPGQGEIIPAGVYRWGGRLLNQRVYLPLVLKGHTP